MHTLLLNKQRMSSQAACVITTDKLQYLTLTVIWIDVYCIMILIIIHSDADWDFFWCDIWWMKETFDHFYLDEQMKINHFRNHYEVSGSHATLHIETILTLCDFNKKFTMTIHIPDCEAILLVATLITKELEMKGYHLCKGKSHPWNVNVLQYEISMSMVHLTNKNP